MEDFHYQLRHIPGAHNHADALSRWPDHDNGSDNNEQVIALPDSAFMRVVSTMMLDRRLRKQQSDKHHLIEEWKKRYRLCQKKDAIWYWGDALVVTGGVEDHQALLATYHDALTVGHPGVAKMLKVLAEDYWWPSIRSFVWEYIRGCAQCQESKTNTHPNQLPLQPIPPSPQAWPFSTITIDFIVKLPVLKGYNSILTIMGHNCTKAVILLLCCEEISSWEVAKLYLEWVFPLVGLPEQVILDWDTRFTLKAFKEICELLEIRQNIASAYHPQMDG